MGIAVATTRPTSTTTGLLGKGPRISWPLRTPKPGKAEPSRRMELSFMGLEVAYVDRLQTRLLDRQAPQTSAGRDHRGRGFRPHVVVGEEQEPVGVPGLDPLHARDRGNPLGKALPFRLHLDAEAAAEHLTTQLRHRTDERDIALIE